MTDVWQKCISSSGTIRGVAIRCTDLARDLADKHEFTGENARALAEAHVGGFILSSYTKDGERMNLNIKGDGWVKQALVDAYADGTIRGYLVPNPAQPSTGVTFDFSNEGPWGKGLLSVLRKRDDQVGAEPYIGTVPLLTGHLAKDLAFYWLQSEQVPSAVGISVNLDWEGRVASAGGFIVQAMPGATDEEIAGIEARVVSMTDLAKEVSIDRDPVHILSQIFQDMAFVILEKKQLKAQCRCSWERVRRALVLIGPDELQSILDDIGEASVKCEFCTTEYKADRAELEKLIAETKAD